MQTVVAVAQLVESRIVIPAVVGSSPISHPKKFQGLQGLAALFFSAGRSTAVLLRALCLGATMPIFPAYAGELR